MTAVSTGRWNCLWTDAAMNSAPPVDHDTGWSSEWQGAKRRIGLSTLSLLQRGTGFATCLNHEFAWASSRKMAIAGAAFDRCGSRDQGADHRQMGRPSLRVRRSPTRRRAPCRPSSGPAPAPAGTARRDQRINAPAGQRCARSQRGRNQDRRGLTTQSGSGAVCCRCREPARADTEMAIPNGMAELLRRTVCRRARYGNE